MDIERSKQLNKDINLIPLINVIFILLIFFLIAGSIEKFEVIQVDLPVAKSGKVLDQGHLVVVLGQYDEVLLNDELITLDALQPLASKLLKDNPRKIISLKADAELEAKRVIDVMNLLRSAGGQNISIVTQSADKK
jgi:biopolymer transport protein ExbD